MNRIKAPVLLTVVFLLSASFSTGALAAAPPVPPLPASSTPQEANTSSAALSVKDRLTADLQ
jgi:hypothetical protein